MANPFFIYQLIVHAHGIFHGCNIFNSSSSNSNSNVTSYIACSTNDRLKKAQKVQTWTRYMTVTCVWTMWCIMYRVIKTEWKYGIVSNQESVEELWETGYELIWLCQWEKSQHLWHDDCRQFWLHVFVKSNKRELESNVAPTASSA